MRRHATPPTADDIVEMAETALGAIPEPLRELVRGTAIVVEDAADDATLEEMGLENPWELTGLYRGVPLTQKSVLDVPQEPDTIVLYREPILLEWIETGEDLFRLVRNVLVHEIGHHFGLSDADIERLEREG
jgi:predicted Zn-dependent protease with MMP-like domain